MKFAKWTAFFLVGAIIVAALSDVFYVQLKQAKWDAAQIVPVSLIQLLAVPEKVNHLRIDTEGLFVYEEENIALYLNETDAHEGISVNSIELNFHDSKIPTEKLHALDHHYVRIVGRVYATGPSQWPLKSGGARTGPVIGHIEAISELSNR